MSTIMIVEDEVFIAEDIKSSLQSLGYMVKSSVTTGEEAVQRAGSEYPDAVLMDINLRDTMDA